MALTAFNIGNINLEEADVARVLAATQIIFNMPGAQPADIVERIRQKVCEDLEAMVKSTEKRAAQEAADALNPVIDLT
jgi:hypothetical protein